MATRQRPAFVISGIELGPLLGEGGMAVVHEALDHGFSPPRRVAVKLMSTELSENQEFRSRFSREAALVADFRHHHIVHIYSSGEASGAKYIVMEYLPGGTLTQKLQSGPMSVPESIRIAAILADALAYSHSRGIVHRDFKPGNVLFTADGKPVLSDFGVARPISPDAAGLTLGAMIIGAPRYMAPEQALGEKVTDRADVYSLGITLIEMLTGQAPPAEWRIQGGAASDRSLTQVLPGFPAPLLDLLRKCLQVKPQERPDAATCKAELESLLRSDESTVVRSRRIGSWASRQGVAVAVIAAIVVVAAISAYTLNFISGTESKSGGRWTIVRQPATARVYVDGRLLPAGDNISLSSGQQLIAVAPGFYGEIRPLVAGGPARIEFALRPTGLPSAAEYERFLDLTDSEADPKPVIAAADVESISEPTLRTALRYGFLRQSADQTELDKLTTEVESLARHGDSRAAVSAMLIEGIRDGETRRSAISDGLMAAAERGDAMASLLIAAALRAGMSEARAGLTPADPDFKAYCGWLARAAKQGWAPVADKLQSNDRCERLL